MTQYYSEVVPALYDIEVSTKAILDAEGVQPIHYISYLNFSREVWKKTTYYSGLVLRNFADVIKAKWVARGLSAPVLNRILDEVFGLFVPPAS
jgi:hypothetical protein